MLCAILSEAKEFQKAEIKLLLEKHLVGHA